MGSDIISRRSGTNFGWVLFHSKESQAKAGALNPIYQRRNDGPEIATRLFVIKGTPRGFSNDLAGTSDDWLVSNWASVREATADAGF